MTLTSVPAPLRVGVVGLGIAKKHLEAYDALPGVEIVALSGKEDEALRTLGGAYGVRHLSTDYRALLDVPDLDAVSIAVPTFLHADIAIAALERGIHVLVEKPIARDAAEGLTMVSAARSAGRVLEVAFNHRRRSDVQALHTRIEAGELGRPYFARASWQRRRGIPTFGSWFTNRGLAGGGPLIDLGVHALDFALFLLQEPTPVRVSAVTYAELGPHGRGGRVTGPVKTAVTPSAYEVEDFAAAFIHFSDGATLILEAGWAAYRPEQDVMDFSVLGTAGGATLIARGASKNPRGELTLHRDDGNGENADEVIPIRQDGRAHGGVVEDFISHVRDRGSWARHDGSLALRRTEIIDACYRSASEKREVTL